MYEQANEYAEDKKCRICGYADKENVNIFCKSPMMGFGRSNFINLYEKITTVYPMVLYEDDPLPKNICKKCANYVSNTYNDIQKVVRQQQRWIENVRNVQPDNKYLTVLNTIETSLADTKRQLQLNYNIDLKDETLQKLFMRPKTPDFGIKEEEQKTFTKQPLLNDNFVKDIQSKLELNGCTVKKVKLSAIPDTNIPNSEDTDDNTTTTETAEATVTATPTDEMQLEYSDDELAEPVIKSCQYCPLKFENVNELALHQNTHLILSVEKIFQKHILPTRLRRGRLITIEDKKCIRCLNCWRIFSDQSAILAHWYRGDCDYYCLICDKEFPEAPKLLREHTMEVHGVSYRSAKRQFMIANNIQIPPTSSSSSCRVPVEERRSSMPGIKNSPLSKLHASVIARAFHKAKSHTAKASKHSASPTVCPICHASFSNWRSRNSHMRKHKPSVKYGDVVLPPDTSKDKYETFTGPNTHRQMSNVTVRTNQVRFPIRLMKNGVVSSFNKKYMANDYTTAEPASSTAVAAASRTSTTTLLDKEDFLIKSEPLDSYEEGKGPPHLQMIDGGLVETIIKSEPIEHDNQLLAGLAEANVNNDTLDNDDNDEWHCFTCNDTFSNVTEFERHTMFAHNPNFDW